MFIHTVYFYMSPDATAETTEQTLTDCREYLGKIAAVRHIWAGRPAGTPLDVVDNSYGVGLTVIFDDVAGHDAYQIDPLHLEFIARNEANWKSVQVFDALE